MENHEKGIRKKIGGLGSAIFAGLILLFGVFTELEDYIFRQNAVFVEGRIVEYIKIRKRDKSIAHKPIIEYKVKDSIIQIKPDTYIDISLYKIGKTVSVCYDSKNIQKGRFIRNKNFKDLLGVTIGIGILLLFLIMGIYQYNKYKDYKWCIQ